MVLADTRLAETSGWYGLQRECLPMFTSSCVPCSRGTRCSRWCQCGCHRTVSDTAACGGGQAGPVSRGAGLWLHSKQVGGVWGAVQVAEL